jgi:hypothetical protein
MMLLVIEAHGLLLICVIVSLILDPYGHQHDLDQSRSSYTSSFVVSSFPTPAILPEDLAWKS